MRLTLASLNQVQQTSASLRKTQFIPTYLESPPVKKKMQYLAEMTFIYILKLLGVEDEEKLSEIVSRLKEGSPFYDFTVLAHNLAKSKTDFDFLSSPENLPTYAKIAEVSKECGVVLLPYVNVLARIAENKLYGLYKENQEVGFFLDEYARYKDLVDAKEFLHQFRKILKYRTQKLFEKFISDDIFSIIRNTLYGYSDIIAGGQTLALYVYCLRYYKSDISNDDENFLHEHISFCVDYLAAHENLKFHPQKKEPHFPNFKNDEEALRYLNYKGLFVQDSLDSFCGLLKDICPTEESIEFCEFLRNNLYKPNPELFDDRKNQFNQLIAEIIRGKAHSENTPLYKDMCKLLPERIVCERSPHLLHHGGHAYFHMFNMKGKFLFYAMEDGNKNEKIPKSHVPIEMEILKSDNEGRVISWNWNERKSVVKINSKKMQPWSPWTW